MFKYLLIALLLIWLFYSPAIRHSLRGKQRPPASPKPAQASRPAKAEAMVACARCGVHLPEGEALKDPAGRPYCSAAHRQAGPAAH